MPLRSRWSLVLVVVIVSAVATPAWLWFVDRVEVEPDTFLVVTHRWGKPLQAGEIVAPDASHRGIQRQVLAEGRHFLNPLFYAYERHPVLKVPEKHCAVLIRKVGEEISPERKQRGEFLAAGEIDWDNPRATGERGVLQQVLGPGKYRLNPYEYDAQVVKAVEIESQEVGVKILRWGKDPALVRENPYVVAEGERGVQSAIVPSGTHYINPYVEEIVPVDVRSHTVIFEDIEFPSKDGFTIEPRVEVRYKVIPEKAPELFVMLCENGVMPQKDETPEDQRVNPILQIIVLPLIRGYVRIEGSKHGAREYISKPRDEAAATEPVANPRGETASTAPIANPRERLQQELMAKAKPECAKIGVDLEYVAVGQTRMNPLLEELAAQIREREQARITRQTNEQKVAQFVQEQELKSTEALADQRQRIIDANTTLEQAKNLAQRRIQSEEAGLTAALESAQARLEGTAKRAEAILTKAKADVAVIAAENEAAVAELRTAVQGFPSPHEFAQYHVLTRLAPALSEIFASDTSAFAKLFSDYLTPSQAGSPKPPRAPAVASAAEPDIAIAEPGITSGAEPGK